MKKKKFTKPLIPPPHPNILGCYVHDILIKLSGYNNMWQIQTGVNSYARHCITVDNSQPYTKEFNKQKLIAKKKKKKS